MKTQTKIIIIALLTIVFFLSLKNNYNDSYNIQENKIKLSFSEKIFLINSIIEFSSIEFKNEIDTSKMINVSAMNFFNIDKNNSPTKEYHDNDGKYKIMFSYYIAAPWTFNSIKIKKNIQLSKNFYGLYFDIFDEQCRELKGCIIYQKKNDLIIKGISICR